MKRVGTVQPPMMELPDAPRVEIIEEGMREGMQIEDASITVTQKLRLLDALSQSGLSTIVVGSFVSPKWTPQMAHIDELIDQMTPVPGVTYTALALNEIGRSRLRRHVPPLSSPDDVPQTFVHACDVFVRRNTNRSQADEIAEWEGVIERSVTEGAQCAGIAINAAWGSNWLGPFDEATRMDLLERQYELWRAAGVVVDRVWLGDPMGWNIPHVVASQLRRHSRALARDHPIPPAPARRARHRAAVGVRGATHVGSGVHVGPRLIGRRHGRLPLRGSRSHDADDPDRGPRRPAARTRASTRASTSTG